MQVATLNTEQFWNNKKPENMHNTLLLFYQDDYHYRDNIIKI